ncbi:IS1380 family transposase [bacterium]|nr:IS1380 family transposase [bacterium]
MEQKDEICKQKINKIGKTADILTGSAGLALFVSYLSNIGIYKLLERFFGGLRRSKKGVPICNIFKQLFCFFLDGTSFHISRFDELLKDRGYIEVIENDFLSMCSSHRIYRFFHSFYNVMSHSFRVILQELFIWRLLIMRPAVIIIGLDTMVMNNNDAKKRQGVEPTYKKVKGFQPLQLTWLRFIIDAVFRSGKKHSNHGDAVVKVTGNIVEKIRRRYRDDVPIILCIDSGFFDQVNFKFFDDLNIGYICSGKLYDDLKEYVYQVSTDNLSRYENKHKAWDYVEFGDMRGNWDRFRRAIYLRPEPDDDQLILEFARPETVVYTNLGVNPELTELFINAGKEEYFNAETIIQTAHNRGRDELDNRAFKDFGTEQLPLLRFTSNEAFYYTMLIAFFLYESFKEDVTQPAINITVYPTTFRRKLIDIAAKIVHHGGKITLKVTEAVWEGLNFSELWRRCNDPPNFSLGLL